MKYLILMSALLFAFSPLARGDEFGRQVKIYQDSTKPPFLLSYSNHDQKLWILSFSIWNEDILSDHTLKTLAWRIFDSASGNYINSWVVDTDEKQSAVFTGPITQAWSIDNPAEAELAIKGLANLRLVLSVNKDLSSPIPTHFINLGAYCLSNTESFSNLSTGKHGCQAD